MGQKVSLKFAVRSAGRAGTAAGAPLTQGGGIRGTCTLLLGNRQKTQRKFKRNKKKRSCWKGQKGPSVLRAGIIGCYAQLVQRNPPHLLGFPVLLPCVVNSICYRWITQSLWWWRRRYQTTVDTIEPADLGPSLPTSPSQLHHGHLVEHLKITLPNHAESVRMSVKVRHAKKNRLLSLIKYLGSHGCCPPLGSFPPAVTGRWWGPSTRSRCSFPLGEQKPGGKQPRKDEKMQWSTGKFKMNKWENPPHKLCWPEKNGRCCNSPLTGDLKWGRSSWIKSELIRYKVETGEKKRMNDMA